MSRKLEDFQSVVSVRRMSGTRPETNPTLPISPISCLNTLPVDADRADWGQRSIPRCFFPLYSTLLLRVGFVARDNFSTSKYLSCRYSLPAEGNIIGDVYVSHDSSDSLIID